MKTQQLTTLTLFVAGSLSLHAQKKPNILFIMTDQQSWNMLSCDGNRFLKTPAMDQIAQNGYRFNRSYCVNPVSLPSRFALLTGHYGSEVNVRWNTAPVNRAALQPILEQSSLGTIFQKAGYETLYGGKTHLPVWNTQGTANKRMQTNYGFSYFCDNDRRDLAVESAKIIANRKEKDQPLFLFISLINPHDICFMWKWEEYLKRNADSNTQETQSVKEMMALRNRLSEKEYKEQLPPLASNFAPLNDAPYMDSYLRFTDKERLDLYSWAYHRFTEKVDGEIALILDALENSVMKENTIIVFTSDHGDQNGAHQLVMKNRFYEESTRIPFIFSGPGIKKGIVDHETMACNGLDLIPTLCDLTNIEKPQGLTGISLKPQLTGKGKPTKRDFLFLENTVGYMVMDGKHKYALYDGPQNNELLIDLQNDPQERRNVLNENAYQKTRKRLHSELITWVERRELKLNPSIDKFPKDRVEKKQSK